MPDGHLISDDFLEELNELVRWWRVRKDERPRETTERKRGSPGDIAVMLLEDLDSGQTARAAVLAGEAYRNAFLLTIYGDPVETDTFDLTWQQDAASAAETVEQISMSATPAELSAALQQLSFVKAKDIVVQGGNHIRVLGGETVAFNVHRYIVEAKGRLRAAPLPTVSENAGTAWMGVESTIVADTQQVETVSSIVPVGLNIADNTPMIAGAFAICTFVETFGWTVHAIEARHIVLDLPDVEY